MNNQELFVTGIIAALAGYVSKCAFGHWEDYQTHKIRPYNLDGDLDSPDYAMQENPNTGSARLIRINRSVYFACPGDRGFYCEIIERNENGQLVARAVQYSFSQMREVRKNLTHIPRLLDDKDIADMARSGVLELCPVSVLQAESVISEFFPERDEGCLHIDPDVLSGHQTKCTKDDVPL